MKPAIHAHAGSRSHWQRIADATGCGVRLNPTLVHHGRATRASHHIVTDDAGRSAVADLYYMGDANAAEVAQKIANVLSLRLRVLRNDEHQRNLEAHSVAAVTTQRTRRARNPKRRNGWVLTGHQASYGQVFISTRRTHDGRADEMFTTEPSEAKVWRTRREASAAARHANSGVWAFGWKWAVAPSPTSNPSRSSSARASRRRRATPSRKIRRAASQARRRAPFAGNAAKTLHYLDRSLARREARERHTPNPKRRKSILDPLPPGFEFDPLGKKAKPGDAFFVHPGEGHTYRGNTFSFRTGGWYRWGPNGKPEGPFKSKPRARRAPNPKGRKTPSAGPMAYREAVRWLGADHVAHIVKAGPREVLNRRAGAWVANMLDSFEAYDTVLRHHFPDAAEAAKRDNPGPRVVYNKLLGGWYVVTGPHQTPLNGRFPSKAAAQAWLAGGVAGRRNPSARAGRALEPAHEALAQKIHATPMNERTHATYLWNTIRRLKAWQRNAVLARVHALDGPEMYGEAPRRTANPKRRKTNPEAPLAVGQRRRFFPSGVVVTVIELKGSQARIHDKGSGDKRWMDAHELKSTSKAMPPMPTRNPRGRRAKGKRARKRNPRSPREGAEAMFAKWHEFRHSGARRVPVASRTMPSHLAFLGEVTRIDYKSDKYDGKLAHYTHSTKSPRPLLASDAEGRQLYLVGGRMKATADGLVN